MRRASLLELEVGAHACFYREMIFHYDLYPAELLRALLRSEKAVGREGALEGVKALLYALIVNDTDGLDGAFAELANAMLSKAQQRSETYRRNALRRDYSQRPESKEPEQPHPEEEKAPQKAQKAPKHALDEGGFVMVTDAEHAALFARFGDDLPRAVQILANYKESNGKKYKSDAAALRGWVSQKMAEDKERKGRRGFKAEERARDAEIANSVLTEEQRRAYDLQ